MKKIIKVKNIVINIKTSTHDNDFICLTDIAKSKNPEFPADVVKNWLKTRFTIEFIGIWEQIHNPNFKVVEFDQFKNQAGVNSFVLSPEKWINTTNAIGIKSKSGRYGGGTYAHKDIAFEFASWISAEFKLFLIKEFQRLKIEENKRLALGWDLKRQLTKINYKVHTDAIKEHLIPAELSKNQESLIYASEADVLNVALFGKTAKQWRIENTKLEGNIRDYSTVEQLLILANLEAINADLINQKIDQSIRLHHLNQTAITQMKSLLGLGVVNKLEKR